MSTLQREKQHLKDSAILPIVFVVILWLVKIAETISHTELTRVLGVYPRHWSGLRGILTYPLVHGDWEHLLSNTMPLLVLGFLFMNSYRILADKVLPLIYLFSGIGIWLIGRPSNHIGASGLVYGLAFFLFFSGVWRKDRASMALAAFVAIFYGSMTWGLYPMEEGVSWEGHLAGAIVGTLCAYRYRHINPPPRYDWELEPTPTEEEQIVEHPFWVLLPSPVEEDADVWLNDNDTQLPEKEAPMTDKNAPSERDDRGTDMTTDTTPLSKWKISYHFVPSQEKKDT